MAKASFGWLAESTVTNFEPLKPYLKGARIKILIKAWVSIIYLSAVMAFFASFVAVFILGMLYDIYYLIYWIMLAFIPILGASFAFLTLYVYPMQRAKSRAKSIENNLPFAVTHMSAIASSGIPPEFMFSLIGGFKEYGEISEEANMIVKNIRTFGSSSIAAMKNVASQTPSKELKDILMGITSTIETGGNLTAYLREMSEKALFDYRIKREKYIKTLATYADIYTALLVAAPLFLLSTMAIMSIIGGDIMGLTTSQIVTLMTWLLLPVMNTAFLMFIHITYPGV